MDFIFEEDMDDVGSDIEAYCPKCKADTAHTVITKYEDEVRRVQCSPCGDVHAFRKPRGEVEDDIPEPIAAKKRAQAKKPSWQEAIDKIGVNKANHNARPYSIRDQYHEGDIVSHPKFGVGFVTEISENKAEVTFQDERRVLVHNRPDLAAAMPAIAPTPAPRLEKGKGKKGAAKLLEPPKDKKGKPAVVQVAPPPPVQAQVPVTGKGGKAAKAVAPPPPAPPPPAPAHAKTAAAKVEPKKAEAKRAPVQGKADRAKSAAKKKEVAKAKSSGSAKSKLPARAPSKPAARVSRPEPKTKVKARR